MPPISHIYTAVADDLHPDETVRDPNRLLFASSPDKGLNEVFVRFAELRSHLPQLELRVADSGYMSWEIGPVHAGTTFFPHLDHYALLAEMRRALCLFYPQTSFARTFGLAIAEANAVGTPALLRCSLTATARWPAILRRSARPIPADVPLWHRRIRQRQSLCRGPERGCAANKFDKALDEVYDSDEFMSDLAERSRNVEAAA